MERDRKRWKEIDRDGNRGTERDRKRWKEMERDRKRWKQIDRDGERYSTRKSIQLPNALVLSFFVIQNSVVALVIDGER